MTRHAGPTHLKHVFLSVIADRYKEGLYRWSRGLETTTENGIHFLRLGGELISSGRPPTPYAFSEVRTTLDRDSSNRARAFLRNGFACIQLGIDEQINTLFDSHKPLSDKLKAYGNIIEAVDAIADAYKKYDELRGKELFLELGSKLEEFKRDLRETAIPLLVSHRLASPQPRHKLNQLLSGPKEATEGVIEEIVASMLLEEIERINPGGVKAYNEGLNVGNTVGVDYHIDAQQATNRRYNCSRVAPSTLAAMYGASIQAAPAHNDRDTDLTLQTSRNYAAFYDSQWDSIASIKELGSYIHGMEEGTYGILQLGYKNKDFGHVTVVGKVNGVACLIEAQTGWVTTFNEDGETRSFTKSASGKVHSDYAVNRGLSSWVDLKVLPVKAVEGTTEFERARLLIDTMLQKLNTEIVIGTPPSRQDPNGSGVRRHLHPNPPTPRHGNIEGAGPHVIERPAPAIDNP